NPAQVIWAKLTIDVERGAKGDRRPKRRQVEPEDARDLQRIDHAPERAPTPNRPPDDTAIGLDQAHAELIVPIEPIDAPRDGLSGMDPQALLQRQEGHWGHAVLVHRIDRVEVDQAARVDVVVPRPLAQWSLVLED